MKETLLWIIFLIVIAWIGALQRRQRQHFERGHGLDGWPDIVHD